MGAAIEVATWEGVELPIWRFETFAEFDHFMDALLPVEEVATAGAWFQAMDSPASGVLFGSDCKYHPGGPASPSTRRAALAVCVIREDLSQ